MPNQAMFSGDPFVDVSLRNFRDLATRFNVISMASAPRYSVNLAAAKAKGTSMHATLDAGSPLLLYLHRLVPFFVEALEIDVVL